MAIAAIAMPALTTEETARAEAPAAPAQGTSTLDDQTELALTVYNSNIALVRDVRTLSRNSAWYLARWRPRLACPTPRNLPM